MPDVDFRLLETMKIDGGRIALLDRHLNRMLASARHFGFACDGDAVRSAVQSAAVRQSSPLVARLLLSGDGQYELQFRPLPPSGLPVSLRLSPLAVNSRDPMLYHKTTDRDIYERARADIPEDVDALLTNERGELTESTIANIAVSRGGVWMTPALSCGLLPGTMRAQLLADGEIAEGIVRAEDLQPGEAILYFNAVRGVMKVPYVA